MPSNHDHVRTQDPSSPPWWKTRSGVVLCGFLLIAGFYLLTEHTAHFFGVLPFLLLLACPVMHLFMHHGHGGHDTTTPPNHPEPAAMRGGHRDARVRARLRAMGMVVLNSIVFIIFAFSFGKPQSPRDWRWFGAFSAFIVALFTEMYGFRLTIYLLSGWLQTRYPGIDLMSHNAGHLWSTLFGLKGNPHFGFFHLLSTAVIIAGFFLLGAAWRVLYAAQRAGVLATASPNSYVRHPQYVGFILVMVGFLLQWPTLLTLRINRPTDPGALGHSGARRCRLGAWMIRSRLRRIGTLTLAMGVVAGLGGCVLAPQGTANERAKLRQASTSFEQPIAARQLPALPAPASWRDVLSRAFLANGELESAYFEWKAALAEITRAATWPNSNATASFSYMFSPGNIKSWNRTTISGGFVPSVPLMLPIKVQTAGRVALQAAREADERFRAVKFDLQRRVLFAYLDVALTEEKIRIERDNLTYLKLLSASAAYRAQTGGPLQDLLKAQIESELAQNELSNFQADAASKRGTLNGLLGRDGRAALVLPPTLPAPRPVAADDAQLLAMAVDQNPELAALARQVAGRGDALELAKLAYLPDIVPSAGITGNVSQVVGAMLMLPTTLPAIRAVIDEAAANERSSDAILRQTRRDRTASFVADLYLMRNAERQTAFYQQRVFPAAAQLLSTSRQEYEAGAVGFADLIDSERTYISVRFLVAQVRIEREKRLAELEALAGTDIETLGQPVTGRIRLPVR